MENILSNNTIFTLICGVLVVQMQLGFALLEAGMVEARIAISVLYKNVMDLCLGAVAYLLVGYWLQTGGAHHPLSASFAGLTGGDYAYVHPYAHLFYHTAFAATAATICSGAVAGRMRLGSYLILSTLITAVFYPLAALLLWDKCKLQFHDLAGSVVVHTVGGSAALAACLKLGTRGKLLAEFRRPKDKDSQAAGTAQKSPGAEIGLAAKGISSEMLPKAHSIPLATAGMFFLFLGWFGFNMGSVLSPGVGQPPSIATMALVAVNTALAGCAGGMAAYFIGLLISIRSLTNTLNGILGGLVAITASADIASPLVAVFMGVLAASLVIFISESLVRRDIIEQHFDDPVGAVPVHLACGILGGLGAIISGVPSWEWQVGFTLGTPFVVWLITKVIVAVMSRSKRFPIRVTSEQAERGLDASLYQDSAYKIYTYKPGLHSLHQTLKEILAQATTPAGLRPPSFSFAQAATFHHHEASTEKEGVFTGAFSRWLARLRELAQTFGVEYSHLGCQPSASQLEVTILNDIADLSNYPTKLGRHEKERHFDHAFDRLIATADLLAATISQQAELELQTKDALNSVKDISQKVDKEIVPLQAVLETQTKDLSRKFEETNSFGLQFVEQNRVWQEDIAQRIDEMEDQLAAAQAAPGAGAGVGGAKTAQMQSKIEALQKDQASLIEAVSILTAELSKQISDQAKGGKPALHEPKPPPSGSHESLIGEVEALLSSLKGNA